MKIKTFIDSGVLIAAVTGRNREMVECAMDVLDDPERIFVSSELVKLEVLPKAQFHKRKNEVEFYIKFFESVDEWAPLDESLCKAAYAEAVKVGLSAMDALHVVAAARTGSEEFVTTEGINKPIHRTSLVEVNTIHR